MYNTRKMFSPIQGNTLVHAVDPRTKIIMLAAFSLTVVFLDNPRTLLVFLILSFIGYPLAKIPLKNIQVLALLLLLLFWGLIYSQALFYQQYPRTVLFTLLEENSCGLRWDGLHIYREGMIYGAVQAMRFAATTSLALLFYWTTPADAMLFGMIKLRIPYGLAFMVITSLRFIPLLLSETVTVLRAQKIKGYEPFKPKNLPRAVFFLLVPVLANCMRRSAKLAISVEGRGFRPDAPRSYMKNDTLQMRSADRILLAALCCFSVPLISCKLL
ncbi:MAG: energy-coupling factor transporter transmembrane protein EcfT, partial [Candidatus Electrothrix sp. ATG1]|nr:energy-coupling factor transporter transmembrane protein EcfT [Candidatus Electrothrix sp. ATG1]